MILNNIDSAYVGADQAEKIYLGTEQIYPSGTPPEPSYEGEYFTIETLGNGDFYVRSEVPYYSINGGEWAHPLTGTPLSLNQGDKVRFKATPNASINGLFSGNTLAFKVYGNIESLEYGDDFTGETEVKLESGFTGYFYNCTGLREAHILVLSATALTSYCYSQMFESCYNLTTAPELLATTLASSCYQAMFYGCRSLTTAPALPATSLIGSSCYKYMFSDCTGLTQAPALPATALTSSCYGNMFLGCASLTAAPELPATTLANNCYNYMFQGCTSLTTAPALPATTLYGYAYSNMFHGCTSLTTPPALPATTLGEYCYQNMFLGCSGLTTFPALPATTLAEGCYSGMFNGCYGMETAPVLPALTLADGCYEGMFYDCGNLMNVTCLATDISATDCITDWLEAVSFVGTLHKNPLATSIWLPGTNIPDEWTVQDYSA